jgi:hypothetical protein
MFVVACFSYSNFEISFFLALKQIESAASNKTKRLKFGYFTVSIFFFFNLDEAPTFTTTLI